MQQAIRHIKNSLSPLYPQGEIRIFTRLILHKLCGIPPYRQLSDKDIKLSESQFHKIEDCLTRLLKEEPIQYILGETEFSNLTFAVTPDVLIPRPETEELVEKILSDQKNKKIKILDIGTGSGCIAITLKKYLRNAEVYAIDISEKAIEIAKLNATHNYIEVSFFQHDIFRPLSQIPDFPETFDLIVSNPPYVMEAEKEIMQNNVLNFEPHTALFVPDKTPLLFYRRIAEVAMSYLCKNGSLYLEINALLGQETSRLIEEYGFKDIEIIKDLSNKERFIKARK
ncbi:MAG: peptide chain release factor N(5)-glutamine methyltransferase [Bacteroidales bacterium]|nr:peptide chain release factor N(5)-glutamine methyltransferase [Bacteroidales bacterium]